LKSADDWGWGEEGSLLTNTVAGKEDPASPVNSEQHASPQIGCDEHSLAFHNRIKYIPS
jgi:hypothetical protein